MRTDRRMILVLTLLACMFFITIGATAGFTEEEKSLDERIAEINKRIEEAGQHWVAGKTWAASLPPEERKKLLGYLPVPDEIRDRLPVYAPAHTLALPTSFDWRNYDGVTDARNQGGCGSCWAFAATAQLEAHARIFDDRILDLSEQAVMACNPYGHGCGGGWLISAYQVFYDYGGVKESCMPYQAQDGIPCTQTSCEPQAKISDAVSVPNIVDQIKQAVYEIGPVACGMFAHDDLYSYTSGCYDQVHTDTPNHAVIIVGWSDMACGGEGAWIIKNSWGESWGTNGFGYIKYGVCSIGRDAYQIDYIPSIVYVRVTHPNGGDTLAVGSEYDITWTTSREVPDSISVLLSLNSGENFDSTIVTGLEGTSTSYQWIVPELPVRTARVKVVAYFEGEVGGVDESDGDFTIQGPPYRFVSPTGGNVFPYSLPRWAAQNMQDAIDASFPGDTIMVEGATYSSPVTVETAVHLYGGWDSEFEIHDPANYVTTLQSAGAIVSFMNISSGVCGIEGFTLTGGTGREMFLPDYGVYGGGVFAYNSSPLVKNNIFYDCGSATPTLFSAGGAVAVCNGTLYLENNTIIDCRAQSGGGIYLYQATADIRNNRISGSLPFAGYTGNKFGGGLYLRHSTVTMESNVIRNNTGYSKGGGIYAFFSPLTMSSDTISANAVATQGGGIFCDRGALQLSQGVVRENTSSSTAGGIYFAHGSLEIENSIIALNQANFLGGGIYADSTWGGIVNNTVDRNISGISGGNILLSAMEPIDIRNNQITFGRKNGIQAFNPANITMQYNNTFGNFPSDVLVLVPDSTNTSRNPHYADTTAFDYHLALHSGGIDTGDPLLGADPDGSRTDQGAFGGANSLFASPDYISGLTATALNDSTIKLSWTEPAGGDVDYYAVYGSSGDGFLPDESNFLGTVEAAIDSFLQVPVYGCLRYRVNALNLSGYAGGYSNQAEACTTGEDIADPQVTVSYPNGGELFDLEDTMTVQWIATDNVGVDSVSIWLSQDGGTEYSLLGHGEPNDSSFQWIVTSINSDSCLVKITAFDPSLNQGEDISDNFFTLRDLSGTGEEEEEEKEDVPQYITALRQNYPNPFNGVTNITYSLANRQQVDLRIYDTAGRLVRILESKSLAAGEYTTVWNGRDNAGREVTSGVYFCRIKAGKYRQTRKVVYLR
ncbi:MAG: right-handed parallel beta-helix repeat-containing protein [Candidatus Krumholzibacteriota bacterium]|nr:right-handed parallel beta-helix repeat-containing protein [Candidatus Krumholzibacteriota bacterium]